MVGDGLAVSSKRGREYYDIEPDIIFIRKDGWSLGAPAQWANAAEATWADEWVAVLLKPSTEPIDYSKWIADGRPMSERSTEHGN